MGRSLSVQHAETICPSAGRGWSDGDALATPLTQSTSFRRDTVGSQATHQYSRVSNPTVAALEGALGDLERALPAACFASGLAAETALFLATLRAGDHVICGRSVYGGTTRLLEQLFPGFGVSATFVDATDARAVQSAIRSTTRLVFVETPANPTLELTDIQACSAIAHEAGALLAVDNTFLTAALQQPLDLGADVSVYSTTKFVEGHSVAMGGALVSRDAELLDQIRFVRKCTGGIQTPFNAWLTINGLKTLALRVGRQSATAAALAQWLSERPEVARVHHPSLATGIQGEIGAAQHPAGHGGVASFEIRGGIDGARAFVERLQVCALAEHVGSVDTLVTHPATMTHADVAPEARRATGVSDGLLRISAGLEPVGVIAADLAQAFEIRESAREEVAVCAAH